MPRLGFQSQDAGIDLPTYAYSVPPERAGTSRGGGSSIGPGDVSLWCEATLRCERHSALQPCTGTTGAPVPRESIESWQAMLCSRTTKQRPPRCIQAMTRQAHEPPNNERAPQGERVAGTRHTRARAHTRSHSTHTMHPPQPRLYEPSTATWTFREASMSPLRPLTCGVPPPSRRRAFA